MKQLDSADTVVKMNGHETSNAPSTSRRFLDIQLHSNDFPFSEVVSPINLQLVTIQLPAVLIQKSPECQPYYTMNTLNR